MARAKTVESGERVVEQEAGVTPEVAPGVRRMERKRYEFVLEAATPIAHHSEVIGNEALIFRRKIRQRDGWAYVPIVTADTMRHGMREAAAYALLDAAGMLDAPGLSEGALRLLFAGGMVTGVRIEGFTASELADVESALTWIAQNKEAQSAESA